MSTIREKLSPTAVRTLEGIAVGAPPQRAEQAPESHRAIAGALSEWTDELNKGPALHLTQAMLSSISDPELRAEVVMASLAHQMREARLGIVPSAVRSPFTASSMSEALQRVLSLRAEDITTQDPYQVITLSMREPATGGEKPWESFVALLDRFIVNLTAANGDVHGQSVAYEAGKSAVVTEEAGAKSIRFLGPNSDHLSKLSVNHRGEWTVSAAGRSYAPALREIRTDTLLVIRQSLLELLGDGTATPVHPGLVALGADLGGKHLVFQEALGAVDEAIKHRAERLEAREREMTALLAKAIAGQRIKASAPAEPAAPAAPAPAPTVGKIDRSWLSTLMEMLKPHGWDGV